EEAFCRLAGLPTPETLKRQYYALRDLLARYRTLREDHVRYLAKCGIVRPAVRTNADTFFGFPDLATIKQTSEAPPQGGAFRTVVRMLLAAREGQLELDFRVDAAPAKIIALRRPGSGTQLPRSSTAVSDRDAHLAEEYFRTGASLDDGDDARLEEAAAAYRK